MTARRRPPPPRPGDVFVLAEPDYRYGIGPIVARVVVVLEEVDYDAEPWWHVEAEAANGTPDRHGGWVRRTIYLRESSMPTTRRPPTSYPPNGNIP